MPYKSQKIKIRGGEFDRRRKLTPEDREEICRLYPIVRSQRKLADMFGVSRRLIIFVLNPEKQKRNYEQRLARGGSKVYYDKDKWRETMKEHRRYKQRLAVEGKI